MSIEVISNLNSRGLELLMLYCVTLTGIMSVRNPILYIMTLAGTCFCLTIDEGHLVVFGISFPTKKRLGLCSTRLVSLAKSLNLTFPGFRSPS